MLFQIPQRYRFSSKSQQSVISELFTGGCFRYHKGTDFQANHNILKYPHLSYFVVLDTTKVQIFKQITTTSQRNYIPSSLFQIPQRYRFSSKSQQSAATNAAATCCFRYHKGTDFQANHNMSLVMLIYLTLFQIPQRYRFSSKSQLQYKQSFKMYGCFRYHKGTDFQANHNYKIFKGLGYSLFQIPQRYRFSSKSQLGANNIKFLQCCFRYHKGTDFQANHN